jgi:cell fate regulator YaaT (PSP1 superfamily)
MGCSSCSSGKGGTPKGCQNNGTCSSGGCNKLGVFNWLSNMALPAGQSPYDILEIRFKNSRKAFYRNNKNLSLQAGDIVVLDAAPGFDTGVVSIVGELARIQVRKKAPNMPSDEIKNIVRIATQADVDLWISAREQEDLVLPQARIVAQSLKLEMKISDVEYQGDKGKATFYYTSEERIDFRQLIKDLADKFKVRVEMRQIGSRQEAQRIGGIGSCGRELCCSTWLTDFRSVSTSAARYQQLSLNPQKLAGQCGKLKCCLNFELDMYLDGIKAFPSTEIKLQTQKGTAVHIKTDVFKKTMWYGYIGEAAGGGLVALKADQVKEIIELNKNSQKPKDLAEFVEVEEVVVAQDYTNVVGQDSLNRFDSVFKSKNKKKKGKGNTAIVPVAGQNLISKASNTPKPIVAKAPQTAQAPKLQNKDAQEQSKPARQGLTPEARAEQSKRDRERNELLKAERMKNGPDGVNPEVQNKPGFVMTPKEGEDVKPNPNKKRWKKKKPGGSGPSTNASASND